MKKFQLETIRKFMPTDPERPLLSTVQTDRNGLQVIVDGFSAYVFKTYVPELEKYKRTIREQSMQFEHIIPNNLPEYTKTDDDCKIWANLDKLRKWLKSTEQYGKFTNPVPIFGRFFNLSMLTVARDILGKNAKNLTVLCNDQKLAGIVIRNDDIEGFLLPIRMDMNFKNAKDFFSDNEKSCHEMIQKFLGTVVT